MVPLPNLCAIQKCASGNIAVSGCNRCRRYLCETHSEDMHHACQQFSYPEVVASRRKALEAEYSDLVQRLRSVDLQGIAEGVRPGHTCTVQWPTSFDETSVKAGAFHIHIMVDFDDGVKWLARVRQDGYQSLPFDQGKIMMESEVIAQHVAQEITAIVPDAWSISPARLDFNICFVEYVRGKHCDTRLLELSPKTLNTIQDYAKFCIALSQQEFTAIGSLQNHTGSRIGPYINRDHSLPDPPYYLGPFTNLAERYIAYLDSELKKLVSRQKGCEDDLKACWMQLEIREMILEDPECLNTVTQTYIKHGDAAGHNIMSHENGTIAGIIDWEWAHVTAKQEAFAAPLVFIDDRALFMGDNALTSTEVALARAYDDLGRSDLGDCVRGGKKYQRLLFSVGFDINWKAFKGLRELFDGLHYSQETEDEWRSRMAKKYADHEACRALAEENSYPL